MTHLADAGHEGRIVESTKSRDVAQGRNQHFGHLRATVVAGSKVEFPHAVPLDCRFLQFVEPDFLIFGENDPALLSNEAQPDCVFGSWRGVASMAFILDAVLDESVENGFAVVKIFVEVQDEVFRQQRRLSSAPIGLLLRFAVVRRHIRKRAQAQIPEH